MAAEQERAGPVARWCATAGSAAEIGGGVLDRLDRLIGFDGGFFATTDPATLLYTSAVRRDMPAEASPAFIRAELGERDVNQLRDLARAPSPVGWLDRATAGDRQASSRYREAMRPVGLGDELRVALRVDGLCWGLVCLHRSDGVDGFTAQDASLLATLAPHLGEALRRITVAGRVIEDSTIDGPGVALVDRDGTIESATPAAARWLAEVADLDRPAIPGLPTVVRSVIERLHAGGGAAPLPRARVLTPSGRWLVIHASYLQGSQAGVAIVIEPASPAVLAPLVVAAYGLTPRETDVVQCLVTGLARKAIAAELRISLHTVNDHVKAIFDKTGVSNAGQLRTRILADHFAPGR